MHILNVTQNIFHELSDHLKKTKQNKIGANSSHPDNYIIEGKKVI